MLLKHGFVTLTMSYQDHQINPPFIVFEIDQFEKTAGSATGGGMLIVILWPRDLHMSHQKLKTDI